MGRSPFFYDQVPYYKMGTNIVLTDNLEIGQKIRIIHSKPDAELNSLTILPLERACSTYGNQEDYFPYVDNVYILSEIHNCTFWRIYNYSFFTLFHQLIL
jgi:hypothetical protein